MDFAQLVLGQIPEAVYFALFLIFTKNLKEKRVLFTIIMVLEYILLGNVIEYDVWLQISYTILTFITLKVLYKEKAQITDVFVFALSSLILILVSLISYGIVYFTIRQYMVAVILNRILLFLILFVIKNKANKLYKKYNHLWNRHREEKVKIRSLTLRNISIILFNLMFVAINLGMIFFLKYLK